MAEILKNLHIDPSRLEQYIEMLGTIGLQAGGGIIRPVYSPAWVQARQQLAGWMSAAGIGHSFSVDSAANPARTGRQTTTITGNGGLV